MQLRKLVVSFLWQSCIMQKNLKSWRIWGSVDKYQVLWDDIYFFDEKLYKLNFFCKLQIFQHRLWSPLLWASSLHHLEYLNKTKLFAWDISHITAYRISNESSYTLMTSHTLDDMSSDIIITNYRRRLIFNLLTLNFDLRIA